MFCEKCHGSAVGCTIFLVFPPGARMWRFVGCPTLEHITYICPCGKHGFCWWIPAVFRDCPCALLMDIANTRRTGNCILLKSNGKSVGISGIRGMKTSLPFAHPVWIVASITWEYIFFTQRLVPLHNWGRGDPSFEVAWPAPRFLVPGYVQKCLWVQVN